MVLVTAQRILLEHLKLHCHYVNACSFLSIHITVASSNFLNGNPLKDPKP